MIPIEKNIIVVDENGNEYEATYPKRAKGLVKNGRARFIDENTICLACPPKNELEDNTMSENINKNQVFSQIVKLQQSLESIDKILFKFQCVTDSQTCVEPEEGEPIPLDYLPDVAMEKIKSMYEITLEREKTLNKMLDIYEKMYDDLNPQQKMIGVNIIKEENMVNNKMIAHHKENGKAVISISNEAHYYIWELVSGWPDIISNDENLKTIADLNMTNAEVIENITNALYQIFYTINTDREVIIRVVNTDKE